LICRLTIKIQENSIEDILMQRSTFKLSVLASSILAVTTLGGCSFLDSDSKGDYQEQPVEEIVIDNTVLNVSGSVLDAKTGAGIVVSADNINFTGDNAGDIDETTVAFLGDGQLSFVASKQDFTANILVSIDGYVDSGITVDTEGSDEANFTIKMVAIGDAPAGTVVEQEDVSASVTSGSVTQEIKVEASVADGSEADGETTEIVIPAGVEMQDEEGNAVDGNITITVAHHSATEAESTDAFPGGFAVVADTSVLDGATSEDDVAMVTAGFVSVKIENESGEQVREFSQPIEITMQVKEGTVHASGDKEGDPIAVGDVVPVWSYEEDKGTWVYEGEGDVTDVDGTDGFLDVTYEASHLSYWNLDWFRRGEQVCNSSTININADGSLLTDQRISMRASLVGSSGYLYSGTIYGDGFATMRRVPMDQDIKFTASIDGEVIGETTTSISAATCGSDIEIDATGYEAVLPAYYPVTATAKSVCDTDGSTISDNVALPVYMNGWYTMPATVDVKEENSVRAYARTSDLPASSTIDGTPYANIYSYKDITVAEGTNSIEFTITQECETVEVTGATGGSSGDQ